MSKRSIQGEGISSETANWPSAKAWLAANDIDPGTVPVSSEFIVDYDAHTLTYTEFKESNDLRRKQERTVPLKSLPEDHNL